MANWKPNANSQAILARAWAILESVPYSVSTRWLFYRLLQEGYYSGKGDYKNKFVKLTARARREFYEGWTPGTLADETREPITRGRGLGNSRTPDDWLRFMADNVSCALDKWHGQENYVELWFEARAMATQFEHYTDHITLVPMGGQPSLDLKWGLARGHR